MKTVACVSGYFNPVTVGHLEYFSLAKQYAGPDGKLLVIVNSDHQSVLKKGYTFMPQDERAKIVAAMRDVDEVVVSIDADRTVCATLRMLAAREEGLLRPTAFLNGGDQNNATIPERPVCEELGIELVDGLGAKIQSSSWLIEGAIKKAQEASALRS